MICLIVMTYNKEYIGISLMNTREIDIVIISMIRKGLMIVKHEFRGIRKTIQWGLEGKNQLVSRNMQLGQLNRVKSMIVMVESQLKSNQDESRKVKDQAQKTYCTPTKI